MGNVRLYGSTSGYTELAPPAVAPDGVLSLPSGTGTLLTAEGGKILQIVRATDATQRTTTSTSFVDVTGMSVTITPTKNTSTILVNAVFAMHALGTADDNSVVYQITDSSNTALSGAEGPIVFSTSNGLLIMQNMVGYSAPATTSAVTYKLRFKRNTGTEARVRNDLNTGQLIAIEVSA
jgi:hypothetical protein